MVTTILRQHVNHSRHVTSAIPPSQNSLQGIGPVRTYGQERVALPKAHQKIVKENISIFVKTNKQ
jgi:hypothetical protein